MNELEGPSRPEKILVAIFKLSKGTTKPCRYEDIVVKSFELFPQDFQLRGYPQAAVRESRGHALREGKRATGEAEETL